MNAKGENLFLGCVGVLALAAGLAGVVKLWIEALK